MMVRMAAAAALIALAGCAGMEPAGRNAGRAPAPPAPPAIESAPGPAPTAMENAPMAEPAPAPVQQAAPAPMAAPAPQPEPEPAAPPPARSAAANDDSGADIVVPGQTETQAQPPDGDPRSIAERREDIRAWDRCVMRAQGTLESDPTRPQLDSAEEVCRRSLGMANRRAVPESRLRRER